MLVKLSIFFLVFSCIGLFVWAVYPLWVKLMGQYQSKQVKQTAQKLDNMFLNVPTKKLFLFYTLTPLALAGIALLFTENLVIVLSLAAISVVIPAFVLRVLDSARKRKFQAQLIDSLSIMTSCLKGGLSLLQSMETLVEEMPPPVSQEFSLVLRENRMGIPLDESLERLNQRMKSEDLNLIVTAVSVAREIGGDLTRIFNQLIYTIREKNKLEGKVKTLTIQAKLQGVIMCFLPVVFVLVIYKLNPAFLDFMLQDQLGRNLLVVAGVLQVLGIITIRKLSRVEV